jgi:hypothetical protein
LVVGTPSPTVLPGTLELSVGTNLPLLGGMVFLGFGVGALPVSPSIAFTGLAPATRCFPELYPTILPNPLIPLALTAAGTARFGTFMAAAPAVAGGILFQVVAVDTALVFHLSTPGTFD